MLCLIWNRLFNTCVLPVVTYASKSWTIIKDMEKKSGRLWKPMAEKNFTSQLQRQDQKHWGQTENATNTSEQPSTRKTIKVAWTYATYEERKNHMILTWHDRPYDATRVCSAITKLLSFLLSLVLLSVTQETSYLLFIQWVHVWLC